MSLALNHEVFYHWCVLPQPFKALSLLSFLYLSELWRSCHATVYVRYACPHNDNLHVVI